ncbi:MAG: response regulator [Planctomycetota bacterium]
MKTVYLCHDQQASPASRQNFLEMAGYDVRLFQGGRDLFLAIAEEAPDLVVLDVLIDGKNGFEVCAEMHRTRHRTFPVILCSHIYRGRAFQDEALNSGASDYLMMPMDLEEFVTRVNDCMDRFRTKAQGLNIDAA